MISHHQSINKRLVSFHKNSARFAKKCLSYSQKTLTHIGIIGILRAILAHNFATYQYFSMKLISFDKKQQITHSLQVQHKISWIRFLWPENSKSTKWNFSLFAIFQKCVLQKLITFAMNNIFHNSLCSCYRTKMPR